MLVIRQFVVEEKKFKRETIKNIKVCVYNKTLSRDNLSAAVLEGTCIRYDGLPLVDPETL